MIKLLFITQIHHRSLYYFQKGFNLIKDKVSVKYSSNINHNDIQNSDLIYSPSNKIDISKYPNKKFIFGPHFSIFPNNKANFNNVHNNAIYIEPSQWVVNLWKDEFKYNSLPLKPYPVGIEVPDIKSNRSKDPLIYFKHRNPNDLQFIINQLKSKNINPILIKYGSYKQEHYLNLLKETKYIIWIDAHESQGYALQEALSYDVPLLVWNVRRMNQEHSSRNYNHIKTEATTITSWDERCGEFFYEKEEFENTFNTFIEKLDQYKGQEFIKENLDLKTQCEKFLELI